MLPDALNLVFRAFGYISVLIGLAQAVLWLAGKYKKWVLYLRKQREE